LLEIKLKLDQKRKEKKKGEHKIKSIMTCENENFHLGSWRNSTQLLDMVKLGLKRSEPFVGIVRISSTYQLRRGITPVA